MKRFLSYSCAFIFTLFTSHAYGSKSHTIGQKGKIFNQEGNKVTEIKIKKGESITFVNDDNTPHNVFSMTKDHKFNLKIQQPNSKSSQTFDKPGEAIVRCAIHPKMKLKVIVE
ncbi:MAG: hypothetical protein HRU19_24390 [Pseudobacteriovorax sp.]|nr:hypothetical protein [Pseudobacteriovorax sp.]